jgi:hypothetical protein
MIKHPTNERKAAYWHLTIGMLYTAAFLLEGLGIWWHLTSAKRHWEDRDK